MKLFPTESAVLAAERKVEQSKQKMHEEIARTQSKTASALMRPLLVVVAGAMAAFFGFRFMRKRSAPSAVGAGGFPVLSTLFALLFPIVARFIEKRMTAGKE